MSDSNPKERKQIERQTIVLDGAYITDTDIRECNLAYSGGIIPYLNGNTIDSSFFSFYGRARNTIEFLESLYSEGGETSLFVLRLVGASDLIDKLGLEAEPITDSPNE